MLNKSFKLQVALLLKKIIMEIKNKVDKIPAKDVQFNCL